MEGAVGGGCEVGWKEEEEEEGGELSEALY